MLHTQPLMQPLRPPPYTRCSTELCRTEHKAEVDAAQAKEAHEAAVGAACLPACWV